MDGETPNIKIVNYRSDPLAYRCRIILFSILTDPEAHRRADLNDYEDEFVEERHAELPNVGVMLPETLVFPASENGGDNVASNEECQGSIMTCRIPHLIKDANKNEPNHSYKRRNEGQNRQPPFEFGGMFE